MPPDRPDRAPADVPESAMYRRIWALAWPTLLYNVLELSLGVADLLMVRGLGFEATAAIGLTRQIAFLVEASALAVATGVIALVSQGVGAGDRRQVEGVMHQGTRLVLLLAPPITLLGYLLSRPLLVAMQADEAALGHAVPYLHIYFLGTVFLWGTVIPAAIFRGGGDAKTPLKLATAVAVLNVPLNYVFIFGAGPWEPMGVAGAAVGTVAARAIGAGLYLVLLTRGTAARAGPLPAAAGTGLAADPAHAADRDAPGPRQRRPQRRPGRLPGAAGGRRPRGVDARGGRHRAAGAAGQRAAGPGVPDRHRHPRGTGRRGRAARPGGSAWAAQRAAPVADHGRGGGPDVRVRAAPRGPLHRRRRCGAPGRDGAAVVRGGPVLQLGEHLRAGRADGGRGHEAHPDLHPGHPVGAAAVADARRGGGVRLGAGRPAAGVGGGAPRPARPDAAAVPIRALEAAASKREAVTRPDAGRGSPRPPGSSTHWSRPTSHRTRRASMVSRRMRSFSPSRPRSPSPWWRWQARATPRRLRRRRPWLPSRTASSLSSRPQPHIASLKPLTASRSRRQKPWWQPRTVIGLRCGRLISRAAANGSRASLDPPPHAGAEHRGPPAWSPGHQRSSPAGSNGNARPLAEATRIAQPAVVLDAARVAHHVAVEAQDVVAGGAGHGLVADTPQPEPLVGVPDVVQGTRASRLVALDDGAGVGSAAVVGDDDLQGGLRLPLQGLETDFEGGRPVVRGDDDGDRGHERPVRESSPTGSAPRPAHASGAPVVPRRGPPASRYSS